MAKTYNTNYTHHVKLVAKRITHRKDVGKAPEPIYVTIGADMMTKSTMTQMTKENPRSLITSLKSPSQKTNFATTPNT